MRSRHLLVLLSWLACTGCLHAGGIVFGQDLRSGGGIVPAPVGPIAESGSLHAGGVVFGKESTRDEWLELILNQSGSLAGERPGSMTSGLPTGAITHDPRLPPATPAPKAAPDLDTFDALTAASMSIRVQVLDASGRPLSGVRASVHRAVLGISRLVESSSDASGSVRLDLASLQATRSSTSTGPELFGIQVPVSRTQGERDLRASVDRTSSDPVVVFSEGGGSRLGLLTRPWTRPDWTVRLAPPVLIEVVTQKEVTAVGIVGTPFRATLAEPGRWNLGPLPAGRYLVTALGSGSIETTGSILALPGEDIQVTLPELPESRK